MIPAPTPAPSPLPAGPPSAPTTTSSTTSSSSAPAGTAAVTPGPSPAGPGRRRGDVLARALHKLDALHLHSPAPPSGGRRVLVLGHHLAAGAAENA
ncbi:hypothetical protein [Nocardioides bruguierae]|uniref:Uncharacterized protein n=1 Tax=Nocardioides bruguierae TaxID=2945102 RepID=A0A9X2DA68_9ACTN|nr:hypothetical protein [Nocardioides bruguierae]MCM0622185.1 hypothetical protein [Nocardioides bruguierae]